MATRKKRRTRRKKKKAPLKLGQERPKYNYFAEAFLLQYNLIALGFFAALAILLWSPLPLLLAVGMEIIYMALVPTSQPFERFLEARDRQERADAREDALDDRLEKLSPWQRQNYERAKELVTGIKNNFDKQADDMGYATIEKLATLKERLLWMMELSNIYDNYLGGLNDRQLEHEISNVEGQLESASGRLAQSLRERLNVLRKRQSRLSKVRENKAIIQNQIKTVMDILHLMQESSMTIRNPSGISQQLDDLLTDVEATEATISEIEHVDAHGADADFDRELEEALEMAHEKAHVHVGS